MNALSRALLRNVALAFVAGCLFLGAPNPASATIRYRVSLQNPEDHLFGVTMTVPVDGAELTVRMAAWNTLYRIQDFAYRVRSVTAVCRAAETFPATVRKQDKQTWRISVSSPCAPSGPNTFEIHYSTEWDEPGPFSSQLDATHAFMNLAEILMYVPDRPSEDVSVTFDSLAQNWRTIAQLPAGETPNSYRAASYDQLVDAPVEAGRFEEFEFDSDGAHLRVVVDSDTAWNRRELEEALKRVTEYELRLMGGPPFDPPQREYTFIFHLGPGDGLEGGGMEHANSTAITMPSVDTAIPIAAHEFFHAWNVKRIRPRSLEPIDLTKEQYSRALWFAEGVTSAYASYTLVRTGLWSRDQFYADLAAQITDLESRPARAWQSAEESSLDAWFEKYEGYNVPDRSISYYNKGQILGVLLDLAIRDATDNRKSLDDVFRVMNAEYAEKGNFYDDSDGVRAAVEEVAGKSFEEFFRRYVSGTDEIPYNQFLGIAGLQLRSIGPHGGGTGEQSEESYAVTEIEHPADRQRRIREGILRGTTD